MIALGKVLSLAVFVFYIFCLFNEVTIGNIIGVISALSACIGFWCVEYKNKNKKSMKQKVSNSSIAIQAGRDVNINNKDEK